MTASWSSVSSKVKLKFPNRTTNLVSLWRVVNLWAAIKMKIHNKRIRMKSVVKRLIMQLLRVNWWPNYPIWRKTLRIVADQNFSRKQQKIAIGLSHPWNHLEATAITTSLTNMKGMTGQLRGSLTLSGQSRKLLQYRRSIRKETRSFSRWLHSSS